MTLKLNRSILRYQNSYVLGTNTRPPRKEVGYAVPHQAPCSVPLYAPRLVHIRYCTLVRKNVCLKDLRLFIAIVSTGICQILHIISIDEQC